MCKICNGRKCAINKRSETSEFDPQFTRSSVKMKNYLERLSCWTLKTSVLTLAVMFLLAFVTCLVWAVAQLVTCHQNMCDRIPELIWITVLLSVTTLSFACLSVGVIWRRKCLVLIWLVVDVLFQLTVIHFLIFDRFFNKPSPQIIFLTVLTLLNPILCYTVALFYKQLNDDVTPVPLLENIWTTAVEED